MSNETKTGVTYGDFTRAMGLGTPTMEIAFGECEIKEGGIPVLRIDLVERKGKECTLIGKGLGWLSPFRGYAFQISGDEEGHGDLGATPVVGLGNLADASYRTTLCKDFSSRSNLGPQSIALEVMDWGANIALMNFCERKNLVPRIFSSTSIFANVECKKFMKATLEFIGANDLADKIKLPEEEVNVAV